MKIGTPFEQRKRWKRKRKNEETKRWSVSIGGDGRISRTLEARRLRKGSSKRKERKKERAKTRVLRWGAGLDWV